MRERGGLFFACLLLVIGLFLPLTEPDEVRYAEIPAAMQATGDWVVPQLHGEAYLDKPPLHYWLVASIYEALGRTPALSRLPSIASALLCAFVLWKIGRRLFGERVALLAATIFLLLPGAQIAAHYANMDGTFTLFTTAAQLALWVGLREERSDLRWVLAAGVSAGLAVLTKGPVALAIIVPPLLLWDWLRNRRLRWTSWTLFGGSALVVVAPWFLAISREEPGFWHHFLVRHHFDRFRGTLEHQRAWWFFVPVFLLGVFPFTAWLPAALRSLFRVSPSLRRQRSEELGVAFLAMVWPVVLFSLSSGKLASYILPSLPFAALLVAWYLLLEKESETTGSWGPRIVVLSTGGLALTLLLARQTLWPDAVGSAPSWFLVWAVIWVLGCAAVWIGEAGRRQATLLAALLLNAQLVLAVLPALAESHSLVGRAAMHAARLADGDARLSVILVADEDDTVVLAERPAVPVSYLHPEARSSLELIVKDQGQAIVVSEPEHLDWMRSQPRRYSVREIDGRGHVFHVVYRLAESSGRRAGAVQ